MNADRRHLRGFTLIEVMISLVVLALAIVGSISAVIAAGKELRDGQTRQVRAMLGDSSARRWMLAGKLPGSFMVTTGLANPIASCGGACSALAFGTGPWKVDPSVVNNLDLSTGAYFKVFGNGEIQHITASTTPAVPNGTACGAAAIPANVYCREIAITSSPAGSVVIVNATGSFTTWPPTSTPAGWVVPVGSTAYTVWIRISKKGDALGDAIYFVDSFVQ